MQIKAQDIQIRFDGAGKAEIILATPDTRQLREDVAKQKQVIAAGKELAVEVKQYRKKRSLDANAYFWALLSKMADVLKTTKDELYLIMLDRYGVFTHIIVKQNAVDKVKQEWRTVRDLGEVTVNGQIGVQLQCYFGSSTYDSAEMAKLIDGVVSECKEMGIETMTPAELAGLKEAWGDKKG